MAAPLTIRFATDLEGAKKGVQDLAATVVSNMVRVGSALKGANDNFQKISGTASALPTILKTAAGAFLAFQAGKLVIEGITAVTRMAAEQVERLAEIGREASAAGVSATFLQNMTRQADALGVKVEAVSKSLQLLKTASTVTQGQGGEDAVNSSPLLTRLRQQAESGNVKPGDIARYNGAGDNEERFKVLLDLMIRMTEEGRKLAALDVGSKFLDPSLLERIRESSDELQKLRTAANASAADAPFSQEQIDRASELNRRMTEAQKILSDGLRPVYDDLSRAGRTFHESNVEWVEYLAKNIPFLVGLWRQLQVSALDAARANAGLPTRFDRQREVGSAVGSFIGRGAQGGLELPGAKPDGDPMAAAKAALAKGLNPTGIERAKRQSQALSDSIFPDKTAVIRTDKGSGKSAAEESIDAIERFVRQLERANETAKAELETVGKSNVEKAKAVGLARLNAAAKEAERAPTEQEIASVNRLAEATARQKDALADAEQAARQTADAYRQFGELGVDALSGLIFEGKSLDETMQGLAKQIGKMALQAAIMGTGPFAGMFGTAAPASAGGNAMGGLFGLLKGFAGGFAEGGDIPAGQWALVGENGPELIRAASSRRTVIPNSALRAPAAGGSVRAPSLPSMAPIAISSGVVVHNYEGAPVRASQANGPQGPRSEILIGDAMDRHLLSPSGGRTLRRLGVKRNFNN